MIQHGGIAVLSQESFSRWYINPIEWLVVAAAIEMKNRLDRDDRSAWFAIPRAWRRACLTVGGVAYHVDQYENLRGLPELIAALKREKRP